MAANGDDLEKEFRKNLKLRRELHGEIAKAKANGGSCVYAGYVYAIGS